MIFLTSSCRLIPASDPSPPISEISGNSCSIIYGDNKYEATITHLFQGITSVTFSYPDSLNGLSYSFSENGCEINFGDLKFATERSFMSDTALPQLINDILSNIRQDGALTYKQRNEPNASTLTTAVFTGKAGKYPYTVITDFDTGYIKEINVGNCDLKIIFPNQ